MGLFSKKDKTTSYASSSQKDSSIRADEMSFASSQSSLKSPSTPGFSKTLSLPPTPRIAMPKAPDPHVDPAGYLRSIGAVRERCALVLEKAQRNQLNHFDVDRSKFKDTTKFVVSIMKVYPTLRYIVHSDIQ